MVATTANTMMEFLWLLGLNEDVFDVGIAFYTVHCCTRVGNFALAG